MSFPIKDIICDFCRSGLDSTFLECPHLEITRINELADDFMNFEKGENTESVLCSNLDIYVDDPRFWEACINFNQKLQRHSPIWIRKIYQKKTKTQIAKIISNITGSKTGKSKKMMKFVRKRIENYQNSATDEYEYGEIEEQIKYFTILLQNQFQQL